MRLTIPQSRRTMADMVATARIRRLCASTQLLLALLVIAAAAMVKGAETIVFKAVTQAILKMDGKQARYWDLFRGEKREHLLLVQLGRRYLLLDTKEREILELDPAVLEHRDKEVRWTRAEKQEKKVESTDWSIRSVGPAVAIRVRLSAEGRVMELQLPRQPDLRQVY